MTKLDDPAPQSNQHINQVPEHVLSAVCNAMGWADTERNREIAEGPALAALTAWFSECGLTSTTQP